MTTKTAQFTPGPWIVETTNTLPGECADNVHRLCYPGYRIHGICAIWNNTRTSKANANLIAAAPAMYEALRHAAMSYHHPSCKAQGEYVAQPERYCTCHVQKARYALAQAEGR